MPIENEIKSEMQDKIASGVLRRLLQHLGERNDVQNIDLMNLSGFCRNCLSKWYLAECETHGVAMDYEQARHYIYGMPYAQWKDKYQTPANPEQQRAYQENQRKA